MPIRRTATLHSLDELVEFLEHELPEALNEFSEELVKTTLRSGVRHARRITRERLPSDGGSYIGTIKSDTTETVSPTGEVRDRRGDIYSDHQWAEAIEEGTKPHRIEAINAPDLIIRKVLGGGGDWPKYQSAYIKTQAVDHPGARAFHIFRDTLTYLDGKLNLFINKALRRAGFE